LAAGADDYIIKPFTTSDFSARVNEVVARVHADAAARSDLA
jgi:DNA-binding response OmpR family regulator